MMDNNRMRMKIISSHDVSKQKVEEDRNNSVNKGENETRTRFLNNTKHYHIFLNRHFFNQQPYVISKPQIENKSQLRKGFIFLGGILAL